MLCSAKYFLRVIRVHQHQLRIPPCSAAVPGNLRSASAAGRSDDGYLLLASRVAPISPARNCDPARRLRPVAGGVLLHQLRPHRGSGRREVLLRNGLSHRLRGAERSRDEDPRRHHRRWRVRRDKSAVALRRAHHRALAWQRAAGARPAVAGSDRWQRTSVSRLSRRTESLGSSARPVPLPTRPAAPRRIVRNYLGVRCALQRSVRSPVCRLAWISLVCADWRRGQPRAREDVLRVVAVWQMPNLRYARAGSSRREACAARLSVAGAELNDPAAVAFGGAAFARGIELAQGFSFRGQTQPAFTAD